MAKIKYTYSFPLCDLNRLDIEFEKKPTVEDWKTLSLWLEMFKEPLTNICPKKDAVKGSFTTA